MIVLFTDFGLAGPYTGQVAAVLHQTAPDVPVISLFADLPAGQPKPAAYLLAAYAVWFPPPTVLLCIVDPGVGGARRALVVEADGRRYVGPDNGLFELVLRRAARAQCREITWAPPDLSASFHGRDLFAPVAAWLACSEGVAVPTRDTAPLRYPDWPDDLAEIVYIDHYGNAMSGLRGETIASDARLLARGRMIERARTFAAAPQGAAFWYVNSNGLVEVAVNGGRADRTLDLAVGNAVAVRAAAAPR